MTSPNPVPIESLLQHRTWMRSLALRLVHDTWDADDVVQEAWLSSLKNPPERAASVRGWLSRVVRNKALDRLRSRRSRTAHEGAVQPREADPSVDRVVADAELHRRVAELVTGLEEPYRTTVLLRFFEGLPPRDVARRMDVPVETVRTRTRRGLERLRDALDAQHGGDRTVWVAALAPLVRMDEATVATAAAGTGIVGVAAMTANTKLGVAVFLAVALGLGAGWFGRAAADDTPVRQDDLSVAVQEVETERGRVAELTEALALRNRRVADLERDLAAQNNSTRALSKQVAELKAALESANERLAASAERVEEDGAPFEFEGCADVLDGIDWDTVGKSTSELMPLIVRLHEAFSTGGELTPEEMTKIQNANVPLMGAAMTIAGKLPGVGPNGPYASPAFMSNLMAATLRAGGHPLTTAQSESLSRLARQQIELDAKTTAAWNESTLELRKLYDEVGNRDRFYAGSMMLLTEEQRTLLRPPAVRDLVQMDIFGASIQWSMLTRPARHNGTREHAGKKIARDFEKTVKPPKETEDDLERIIREWAEGLPDALLEVRQTELDKRGYTLNAHVLESTKHVLALHERIAREIRLGDEALARLRALPGPPVLLRYPE